MNPVLFVRHRLTLAQASFHTIAKVNVDKAVVFTRDFPFNQFIQHFVILVDDPVAFSLTQLLQDDVFSRLRCQAAKVMRRHFFLESVAQAVAMALFPGIVQTDLFFRVFNFGHDRLVRKDLELTRVFIDLYFNVAGVVVGLVGLFQSIRQCFDNDFLLDALFLFQDVHGIKQFLCLLLLLSAHFAAPLLKLDC